MTIPLYFQGRRVAVLSYNVNGFQGWKNRSKPCPLVEILERTNPSVVVLQEAPESLLRPLHRATLSKKWPRLEYFGHPTKPQTGLAILAKSDLALKDITTEQHRVDYKGKPVFVRDFPSVLIESMEKRSFGQAFRLFNFHFSADNARNPDRHFEEMMASAGVLWDILNPKPDSRVLMVGDANARNGSQEYTNLMEMVIQPNKLISLLKGIITHCSRTQLDYGFASAALKPFVYACRVVGSFHDELYRLFSDHLPFLVEIELPDNPR